MAELDNHTNKFKKECVLLFRYRIEAQSRLPMRSNTIKNLENSASNLVLVYFLDLLAIYIRFGSLIILWVNQREAIKNNEWMEFYVQTRHYNVTQVISIVYDLLLH